MRELVVALAGLLSLGMNSFAQAPPPVPPPGGTFPSYNYERAYRHFLSSPYRYRTFSSLGAGSFQEQWTPFGIQGAYVDPSYENQRITPHGYERYTTIPGYGGYSATPFGFRSYYTPGYGYHYYVPPPRP